MKCQDLSGYFWLGQVRRVKVMFRLGQFRPSYIMLGNVSTG